MDLKLGDSRLWDSHGWFAPVYCFHGQRASEIASPPATIPRAVGGAFPRGHSFRGSDVQSETRLKSGGATGWNAQRFRLSHHLCGRARLSCSPTCLALGNGRLARHRLGPQKRGTRRQSDRQPTTSNERAELCQFSAAPAGNTLALQGCVIRQNAREMGLANPRLRQGVQPRALRIRGSCGGGLSEGGDRAFRRVRPLLTPKTLLVTRGIPAKAGFCPAVHSHPGIMWG